MDISSKVKQGLNDQINMEFAAGYLYLSMAAFFEDKAFNGFGRWMRLQSDEEKGHAMRLFDYLNDRGGRVELQAIEKPTHEFSSPADAFRQALEHEQKVTSSIHRLYELAHSEKDYATVSMLKWFVDEQVEEERNASDMVDRLEMAGDNPNALLLLDNLAGRRAGEG